jgi:hypothetical protein
MRADAMERPAARRTRATLRLWATAMVTGAVVGGGRGKPGGESGRVHWRGGASHARNAKPAMQKPPGGVARGGLAARPRADGLTAWGTGAGRVRIGRRPHGRTGVPGAAITAGGTRAAAAAAAPGNGRRRQQQPRCALARRRLPGGSIPSQRPQRRRVGGGSGHSPARSCLAVRLLLPGGKVRRSRVRSGGIGSPSEPTAADETRPKETIKRDAAPRPRSQWHPCRVCSVPLLCRWHAAYPKAALPRVVCSSRDRGS